MVDPNQTRVEPSGVCGVLAFQGTLGAFCPTTPDKMYEDVLSSVWCGINRISARHPSSRNTHQMSVSLQRVDTRLSLLQSAVDEYYKAKNDFAAKVNLFRTILPKRSSPKTACLQLLRLLSVGH